MNSLDVLKNIYKPYRYTIKGKATIINTTSGDYVIKNKNDNVKELFNYLDSRNFNNYPKIIDENRNDLMLYEYVPDTDMPNEQRGLDLIKLVSNLHHKTTYFKEVSQDTYQTVYDNVKSNIDYLKEYYFNLYNKGLKNTFHSPSEQVLMYNFYGLRNALQYCEKTLDDWFSKIKKNDSERVSVVHNNLKLEHFIKSNNDYLISWDDFKIDTPVLDLAKFYQNNYLDLDFKTIFETYFNNYPLTDEEKELLYILITLPHKVDFKGHEFDNTKEMSREMDYIFKTAKLVRPDDTQDEEKQETNFQ
jgi:hypothetical protein